jgi:hypothetical protein
MMHYVRDEAGEHGKWYEDITNIDVIVHNQKLIMFTGVVEVGLSAVVRITGTKG